MKTDLFWRSNKSDLSSSEMRLTEEDLRRVLQANIGNGRQTAEVQEKNINDGMELSVERQ